MGISTCGKIFFLKKNNLVDKIEHGMEIVNQKSIFFASKYTLPICMGIMGNTAGTIMVTIFSKALIGQPNKVSELIEPSGFVTIK